MGYGGAQPAPNLSGYATTAQLAGKADASALASKADASAIPVAATSAPPAVAAVSDKGNISRYALENHTHKSSVQRAKITLDASGLATWTFAASYPSEPVVTMTYQESANNPPIVLKVVSYVTSAGQWTGVNIKGYRSQTLPVLSAVSGVLTAVITGVNAIVTALTGFNVFGGAAPSAIVVNAQAAAATQ